MLYKSEELIKLTFEELEEPVSRYCYKFDNRRSEIKKLKEHEKFFLFSKFFYLRNLDGNLIYDIYDVPEADEFLFNKLILTHKDDVYFNSRAWGPYGELSTEEINRDKKYFDSFYLKWVEQLESRKGIYMSALHTEIYRKIKPIKDRFDKGRLKTKDYRYRIKYLNVIAFFIYYKVKLFFDERKDKHIIFNILGYDFVINIYTYIHVLSRHYIPSMDFDNINIDRSINEDISIIDAENLPISLQKIIVDYYDINKILNNTIEYILFSYNNQKYIIWIKYKKIDELNQNYGFHIRTVYQCTAKHDIDKFEELNEHKIDTSLSYYF